MSALSAKPVLGLIRSRTVLQTGLFAASSWGVSIVTAVSVAVLARTLGTDEFGAYSFAIALLAFVALFFDFGLLLPAARLAATASVAERRAIVGASLAIYAPIGLLFSGVIAMSSIFVDDIFRVHAGHALLVVAPLALVFPFKLLANWLAQGVDRLHVYSVSAAVGQLLFLVLLFAAVAADGITVAEAVLLQAVALLLGWLVLVGWLHPTFVGLRANVWQLVDGAKRYGLEAYIGRVLGIGTYNMDVLMLGALTSASAVGYYSLAGSLAAASGLIVIGFATALFPRMAQQETLEPTWLVLAWVIGIACALLAWALARPFVDIVLSHRYAPASALVLPLALAQAVRGVTTIYNYSLSARGHGRDLRNAGLALTGANLVLNLALIPPYGATGAAWASLIALTVNLVVYVVFYRRRQRRPGIGVGGAPRTT